MKIEDFIEKGFIEVDNTTYATFSGERIIWWDISHKQHFLIKKNKIPFGKALSDFEQEWDNLSAETQEQLKELAIARLNQMPSYYKLSIG
jgi:hypothetical protein